MKSAIVATILALSVAAYADEQYDITPGPTGDVIVGYHLDTMVLSSPLGGSASITIQVLGKKADGTCAKVQGQCVNIVARYEGEKAVTLLNQLNVMNFSTTSLRKRIMQRLVTDGYLPAGVVSGTVGLPTLTPAPTATATVAP